MPSGLEVAFDASGATEAGARGRVVCVVDVVDAATSAEAALAAGALAVLGASPAGATVPVEVDPVAVGGRAAELARETDTGVVVVAEPRTGPQAPRAAAAGSVLEGLGEIPGGIELVANQGAELPALVRFAGQVVVVVSATGGVAFDAALRAGAPAVCFATTARIVGKTGWDVTKLGTARATALAGEHGANLSVVAASANSTDDCLAAFELARTLVQEGYLRHGAPGEPTTRTG